MAIFLSIIVNEKKKIANYEATALSFVQGDQNDQDSGMGLTIILTHNSKRWSEFLTYFAPNLGIKQKPYWTSGVLKYSHTGPFLES